MVVLRGGAGFFAGAAAAAGVVGAVASDAGAPGLAGGFVFFRGGAGFFVGGGTTAEGAAPSAGVAGAVAAGAGLRARVGFFFAGAGFSVGSTNGTNPLSCDHAGGAASTSESAANKAHRILTPRLRSAFRIPPDRWRPQY